MNSEDAFRELRLPLDASPDDIRAAFRQRAKKTHPDHDGDAVAMQRLNDAKKAALESAELDAHPGQALILREVLSVEARRNKQEAARASGQRLVDGAAAFEVGRLKQLQRHASIVTVASAAAVALAGLLRFLSSSGGPGLDVALGCLAIFAIASGLYRTILSERISQIESAINDVGRAVSARAIYAEIFRSVTWGLINPAAFMERDVALAVDLWLEKSEWPYLETVSSEEDSEDVPADFVSLDEILQHCAAEHWRPDQAFETLRRLTLSGDIPFLGSPVGLCFSTRDIMEAAHCGGHEYPRAWSDFIYAVSSLAEHQVSRPRVDGRSQDTAISTIKGFLQPEGPDGAEWLSRRFKRLAREIGTVDLTRLLLGKGLENEMLAEEETVDGLGGLATSYSYVVGVLRDSHH